MELDETLENVNVESARNKELEEVRQKRLAYFQNVQTDQGQITGSKSDKTAPVKPGASGRTENRVANPPRKEKHRLTTTTSEFHMTLNNKTDAGQISKKVSNVSEEYISAKISHNMRQSGNKDLQMQKSRRKNSGSSISDDDVGPVAKPTRPAVNAKPSVSGKTPQLSKTCNVDFDRARRMSHEDVKLRGADISHRVVRNSGDSEVESLFSNRKRLSSTEIPAVSLKESVDIDSVSVFKSSANFEDLGLSTHRPESMAGSSIIDFGDKRNQTRLRSMSSEGLLLGGQAEEMRKLLGEQKYKEFVEKSERELSLLHNLVEDTHSSLRQNPGDTSQRSSRIDGSAKRNTPTPPPSPQITGSCQRGTSPRRRLRSSSPQMMSKTLQDIARTKEIRESISSRNYEQVVVPRNVTFSSDEIYRQAYGGGGNSNEVMRMSSTSSIGSGYQDQGSPFWNTVTPRQMAGSMSPSSAHTTPIFQPPFNPINASGMPISAPMSQQPVYAGSPGTGPGYFYSQGGVPMNMAGGGGAGGQFMYPRQQNMFVGGLSTTPPHSPDSSFLYQHVHPLSQSMPAGFHTANSPTYNPAGISWQYTPVQPFQGPTQHFQGQGQTLQGHGQQLQGQVQPPHGHQSQISPRWSQKVGGGELSSSQRSQSWLDNHGPLQSPHPPAASVMNDGAGDRSQNKSAVEHIDAVRQHHEQRRHVQDKPSYANNFHISGNNFSATSIERYFASLGLPPPPNYPPPPYNPPHHPPTPSQQLPSQHQQRYQNSDAAEALRISNPQRRSADSSLSDDEDMTTVTRTSLTTGTSILAGGITERMEQLGVDPQILQSLKMRSENLIADEETLDAMRNQVRVCPECQAVNKEYMTWCLQCGGVLIGVDPVPAKDLKKKNKEKRTGTAEPSSSRHKKSHSHSQPQARSKLQTRSSEPEMIPIDVQHMDAGELTGQPLLEYEDKLEVIYSNFDNESSRETMSPDDDLSPPKNSFSQEHAEEEFVGTKESPESGRGASATSSPARRNISRDQSEDTTDLSQNALEITENKDSGRPSSGEGQESRKPPHLVPQMVLDEAPRRSDKEINDICGVINDPIIRGFIKNYLQKKPQDVSPDFSQVATTNQHSGSRQQGTTIKQKSSTKQSSASKPSRSLNLDTSVDSIASSSKSATSERKGNSSKKKGRKKPVKEGHEAIDVEIFGIEEARLCRSARSGTQVVPMLNLALSSDEEDDSSEKTSSLQGTQSVSHHGTGSDSARSLMDDHAPINYSNEVKAVAEVLMTGEANNVAPNQMQRPSSTGQNKIPQQQANHSNDDRGPAPHPENQEMARNNFQFLQQLVENQQSTPSPAQPCKASSQARSQPRRPSPTSKVRSSIDAPPPNRRWMRSSVAWSSYNPRELRTRSSINFQQQRAPASRQPTGNVRASRSTDNLADLNLPNDVAPSQRQRPSSADQNNRRGANRGRPASAGRGGRPYSAGHFTAAQNRHLEQRRHGGGSGDPISLEQQQGGSENSDDGGATAGPPQSQNTDIEGRPIHRLTVQDDTLPLIPVGPSAALKIYDRCCDETPRDQMDQTSKWLFLPDELWLHVFTYLPQVDLFHVTLTCKQLHCISLDPQLWKRVTVRKKSVRNEWLAEIGKRHPVSMAMVQCHGDNVSENTLREFFKEVAPKLKELNFSRCSRGKLIGDEILLHASTHCRHLTHVDASWCHVTDVGLTALSDCCHRLESLCLNGCQQITDDSLKAVVEKHGTSLRVLELFGCFSLSPASFRYLAEHCTFLLTLNMGQCYKISDSNMVTLSASLSRVETLDLRGCKKLGDTSIRKIVRNCRRLRHLTLANCPLLSNAAVVEIGTYSTDIRSLDLCGCSNISDTSIRTLASNCNRLSAIDISSTSCTHKSVLALAEFCRHLESAKFNFLSDIHEMSLSKLIKNCKRLNTIHLYGCNVRDAKGLKKYNRFVNIEM